MIITRTPFRISLFGGGTDYPAWFREHGGTVLGTAIDKYCYLTVRRLPPFFAHRSRIVYSKVELVRDVSEIQHPAVRAVLSELNLHDGLEIHHDADLPARAGLGSSSAFTVGLLNALYALNNQMIANEDLATKAIHIEQNVLAENVGCQDQVWAAYGGFNRIDFLPNGAFTVTPIIMTPERRHALRESMMLCFTGFSRYASEIAGEQIRNVRNRQKELHQLQAGVDAAFRLLTGAHWNVRELGELLHETWRTKRDLSDRISTPQVDEIYEAGRAAGAIGGKLLGAGGGGFMLFVVDPKNRAAVRKSLEKLVHVAFDFDNSGSRVVLYQPNGL
jgi:D-glycero-alpha-D-manno-heptose-7-phosphate kinase